MAIAGILAALVDAKRTGKGRFVDISIADGLFAWIGFITSRWNTPDAEHDDHPFDAPFDKPFYSVYETADKRHLVVGAYEEKFWATLCDVLEIPQWLDKQWCEGEEEDALRAAIAAAFRGKTFDEWLSIFAEREACVTPVLSTREALDSPHARFRGSVITVNDPQEGRLEHIGNPIRFDGIAFNSYDPAPLLGADSETLLREVGYSQEKIDALRHAKAT